MIFKKRNIKKEILDTPIIENLEKRIISKLNVNLYIESNDKIKLLIKEEIKQSQIDLNTLLKYFENHTEELIAFSVELFSKEQGIDESKTNGISNGLGKWFSITYSIYFHFLSKNLISELSDFLKVRKIPKSELFLKRLKEYYKFSQTKVQQRV